MVDSGAISLGGGGGGGGIDQLTGDVTAGPGTGSQAATLANVGTPGTVGDATHYPVVTTDAKGRVTGMVATAVPSSGVDLLQFFQSTLPSSQTWYSVAYGNGVFVAVAYNSTAAAYSTDGGVTWTASTLPSSQAWQSIAYGNGAFVAVAYGSTAAAYSTNGGVTWTASTLPSIENWQSIAYGNGAFVAVAYGSTAAAYSTNGGVTWTASTLPSSQFWYSIAYGNGAFVAVAGGPSTAAAYSTNGGVTWTASTLPSSADWQSIAYGNGAFVAVANGTTPAYTQVVALAGANTATVSNPSVTSGTAFTPSAASNATVYFQINATVAGSYTLTMGPTTGAENTIGSAVAMLVNSDDLVTLNVPRGWLVVLTLTSVTLGSTTVVAM